ncbi:pilus assembly protein [Methanocaldococcus sp. 28A]
MSNTVIIMNMKISIEKLRLVRPKENPKNQRLELDMDWNIEYKKISDNSYGYVYNLKIDELSISFIVEGVVEFDENIDCISKDISQSILDRLLQILVGMINLTKEMHVEIKTIPVVEISAQKVAS